MTQSIQDHYFRKLFQGHCNGKPATFFENFRNYQVKRTSEKICFEGFMVKSWIFSAIFWKTSSKILDVLKNFLRFCGRHFLKHLQVSCKGQKIKDFFGFLFKIVLFDNQNFLGLYDFLVRFLRFTSKT